MYSLSVNGINIHYRQLGDPSHPHLVLINSLGTDFRMWQYLIDLLQDRFRITCYDKRGHGLSDAPPSPYQMSQHYDDLIALLDALEIHSPVLCGDSVGGLIAQGVAARQPQKVRALILCDTAAKIGSDEMWNPRIEAVRHNGVEALAAGTMERWFTVETQQEPNKLSLWRNMLVRTPDQGYMGTAIAIRDEDHTELTRGLKMPALVVVGEEDGATPPELVKGLADLIEGSRFEIIKGAGHLPSIEQPDHLAGLITEFCDGL